MSDRMKILFFAWMKSEAAWLFLVLLTFGAVNLATGDRSPTPTIDEVVFVDPAASFYFGDGLTSTTGIAQDYKSFVVHYGPLHPYLLYAWMCLFGFGCLVVRSFGYLMMGGTALLVWLLVKRQSIIKSPCWRIALIALILGGFGVVHSYRMGRPDSLTMLLVAAAVLAGTIVTTKYRLLAIAAIAALMAPTSPALPAYLAVLSLILLAYDRSRWRDVAAGVAGVLLGVLALYLFYRWHGAWDRYLYGSILGSLKEAQSQESLSERLGGILKDPSYHVCFILLVWLAGIQMFRGQLSWRSPLSIGLILGICIPAAMFRLGHYPAYYSWMAYIPCVTCLCASLDQLWPQFRSLWGRSAIVMGLLMAAAGLPVFVGFAVIDWNARDPALVDALAARNVSAGDWVACDNSAYYAVRRQTRMTFCGMYRMSPEEKQRIEVVITAPGSSLEKLARIYGGQWRDTGDQVRSDRGPSRFGVTNYYVMRLYCLAVYRRVQLPLVMEGSERNTLRPSVNSNDRSRP